MCAYALTRREGAFISPRWVASPCGFLAVFPTEVIMAHDKHEEEDANELSHFEEEEELGGDREEALEEEGEEELVVTDRPGYETTVPSLPPPPAKPEPKKRAKPARKKAKRAKKRAKPKPRK